MMARVLVADDQQHIRDLLVDTLVDEGYEVLAAKDGAEALELALHEHPDIIILDVWMPVMDGFEVLGKLRDNPSTQSVPAIMLTALEAEKGERTGMTLGAARYLTKPWEPGTVELAVKVALRETEAFGKDEEDGRRATGLIRTGNMQLDQMLSGGIPLGSLTLVEGIPSGGKSALCQHLAYEALLDGYGVAYFTARQDTEHFVDQMASLARDVATYFREGKLGIFPTEGASPCKASERDLAALAADIGGLPGQYNVRIVDCVTDQAALSDENAVTRFFSSCKNLAEAGKTVILVARSYAFDGTVLNRLHVLCDAHLSLRSEKIGAKMVKMLEARKVHDADLNTGNMVSFDVVEGIGIRIVPGSTMRL